MARQLNDSYQSYIQTTGNKVALLENEVSLNIRYQDYEGALKALNQGSILASGESFNSEENWNRMEKFLYRRLDQQGSGAGGQLRIARGDGLQTDTDSQPETFALKANYPNPFNPVTMVPFIMTGTGQVRLEVYDMLGRRVATLTDRVYDAGRYQVSWDGSSAASGVYVVRMMVTMENNRQLQFHRSMSLVK